MIIIPLSRNSSSQVTFVFLPCPGQSRVNFATFDAEKLSRIMVATSATIMSIISTSRNVILRVRSTRRISLFRSEMLRGVYPELAEILRFAQNDRRRAKHDNLFVIYRLPTIACSLSLAFSVSPARARESNASTSAFH